MIAFVAARIVHALGVAPEQPFLTLGGIGGPVAQLLRSRGHEAWTLDEDIDAFRTLEGRPVTGAGVLDQPRVRHLLERHAVRAVLPFKTSTSLERAAESAGLRVLAAPARLVRQLENKLTLPALAAAAGVPIPATRPVRLDETLVREAEEGTLQLPLVLQPAMGFAGAGTQILRSVDDVRRAVDEAPRSGGLAKLVQLVEGVPVTVNGVVFSDGRVAVGAAAEQLTGVSELTPTELGSCGNEWSRPLAPEVELRVRDIAARVGSTMAGRGFRGIFGVDVVLAEGGEAPVLIEVNPRLTGSLALQVRLQRRAGLPTLLDAHLAAFGEKISGGISPDAALEAWNPVQQAPRLGPAASVIAFHRGEVPSVPAPLQPGAWRLLGDGSLERTGDALHVDELPSGGGEVVVIPQPPTRPVSRGSELVRFGFSTKASVTQDALDETAASLVRAVLVELESPARNGVTSER